MLPLAEPEEEEEVLALVEVEPVSTNKANLKIKGCRVTQVTIAITKRIVVEAMETTTNTNSIQIVTVSHLSNNNKA